MQATELDPTTESAIEADDPSGSSETDPPGAPVDTPHPPVALWKKLTAVASWIVAAFFLFVVLANAGRQAPENVLGGAALVTGTEQVVVPEDTLGVRFDEVQEAWNSTGQPPEMRSPLRRTPEGGPLDSFYYRFDPQAELIGAYRDSDDYLVALLVRASIEHEDISTVYLHLCHMINPFSPDCLDNYFSIGLGGLQLAELAETGAENSWTYEGNEWRVTIIEGELTIRVLSPGAS
jgi:hypothetical protein